MDWSVINDFNVALICGRHVEIAVFSLFEKIYNHANCVPQVLVKIIMTN